MNARFVTHALLAGALVASLSAGCGSSGGNSTTSSTTSVGGNGHGGNGHGGNGHGGNGHGGASTGTGGASTSSGTGGATSSSSGTASSGSSSGSAACVPVSCQGKFYQCGDCMDNDGDGKVDSEDPDCLGACDNTENNFYGGIPGSAGPACTIDCYFDQDSGAGNDGCYWNHKCDEHEMAPNYYPESVNGSQCAYNPSASTPGTSMTCAEMYASQSQGCLDFCKPLTPNGCDCFGCCELPAGSGKFVWLGSDDGSKKGTCDLAHMNDPDKCQPCKPVMGCFNGCGHCEICIGKPTLPPECSPPYCGNGTCDPGETCSNCEVDCGSCPDGGTSSSSSSSGSSSSSSSSSSSGGEQCPAGVQACGLPGQVPCSTGYYCVTGCCQKLPG